MYVQLAEENALRHKIYKHSCTNHKLNIIQIYTVTLNQSYIVDKPIYNVSHNNQESNAK